MADEYERVEDLALKELGAERLAKIVFAQRWLLQECREVMEDDGIFCDQLGLYLDGELSVDEIIELIPGPTRAPD